ncbi:hypothetical protein Tco_0260914 [Tanacetum coccineum]
MVVLESCPKHNMVAYLEKTDENTEFHEIIDFLTRRSIHYALTVSPIIWLTDLALQENQFRNQMMTYLKHVGNKKHANLKTKSFDEIKALFEKVKRFDDSFITIGSTEEERKIKEMNKGSSDPDKKKKIVKKMSQLRRIAKDVKETLRSDQDLSKCLNTSSMKFKESTPKKHEVKQVQQSCLGEDC